MNCYDFELVRHQAPAAIFLLLSESVLCSHSQECHDKTPPQIIKKHEAGRVKKNMMTSSKT